MGPWQGWVPRSTRRGISRSFVAQGASHPGPHTSPSTIRGSTGVRPANSARPSIVLKSLKNIFFSAFSPGQEFATTGQKMFEPTGFQNTLSGMYSPVVFSAAGADLREVYLFCFLACDRDACCDGFILAQVQGGNVNDNPRSAKVGQRVGSQKPGCTGWRRPWDVAHMR